MSFLLVGAAVVTAGTGLHKAISGSKAKKEAARKKKAEEKKEKEKKKEDN